MKTVWVRWLSAAALAASVVLVGGRAFASPPDPGGGSPAGAAPVGDVLAVGPERADAAAAGWLAHNTHQRVEVTSLRSQTGRVFINPDGTRTLEQYAVAQRVRRADGSWAAVDTTLQANADGTVSPVAATVDVRFSGGGSGPMWRCGKAVWGTT